MVAVLRYCIGCQMNNLFLLSNDRGGRYPLIVLLHLVLLNQGVHCFSDPDRAIYYIKK